MKTQTYSIEVDGKLIAEKLPFLGVIDKLLEKHLVRAGKVRSHVWIVRSDGHRYQPGRDYTKTETKPKYRVVRR